MPCFHAKWNRFDILISLVCEAGGYGKTAPGGGAENY